MVFLIKEIAERCPITGRANATLPRLEREALVLEFIGGVMVLCDAMKVLPVLQKIALATAVGTADSVSRLSGRGSASPNTSANACSAKPLRSLSLRKHDQWDAKDI